MHNIKIKCAFYLENPIIILYLIYQIDLIFFCPKKQVEFCLIFIAPEMEII